MFARSCSALKRKLVLARARTDGAMRLSFDQGTLVLSETPDRDLGFLPGVIWDPRVALWRAPAHRHAEVVRELTRRRMSFRDEARPRGGGLAGFAPQALRSYQSAALLAWELAERRGITVLPTGSGKTRVALAAIAQLARRTLCIVPTRALLQQWLAEVARARPGAPLGCLGDGEQRLEALTIATFESAWRRMPEIGREFELLVVDEVHHFGTGLRDEALEMCVAPYRLGLTATPPDADALDRLSALVGPVVYQLGVADLAGRFLADLDLVVLRLGLEPDERLRYESERRAFNEVYRAYMRSYPGAEWREFQAAAMQSVEGRAALAGWRKSRAIAAWNRAKSAATAELLGRHSGSKVLVFTADNDTAYAIAKEHLIMPVTCDIQRRERDAALAAFRKGEIRALVSARVLNEGIDVPDADVAIIVGGTQNEREHVQRVGRLLRPAPGKRALVYELVTRGTSEIMASARRRRGLEPTSFERSVSDAPSSPA
jgi:superfamily II DNA or RNA helicase